MTPTQSATAIDPPEAAVAKPTMVDRLRQLADWCDRHPEIAQHAFAPDCGKVQLHAKEFMQFVNDGREIELDRSLDGTHYRADVDGVRVVAYQGFGTI